MPGLAPQTLRLDQPAAGPANDAEDILIEDDPGQDVPEISDDGAVLKIEHADGSISISLDGRPLQEAEQRQRNEGWFANLVDRIDQSELGRIADDLIRGIDDDLASRKEWTDSIATGVTLLGLKIEVPGVQGASDGAPVEGMSKVRDPALLEAVLRFQANARSELLPTDGPVKVRDDSDVEAKGQVTLANALEADLNHYLTVEAPEYYPDTDRMLFKLGFQGGAFKKVYFCPLRMRPVSETIDADDLIVNNAATDLANAERVTHRIMMPPATVRRMQILGIYRDIPLGDPKPPTLDNAQRAEASQQGVNPDSTNPEDRRREIYECYCELDIAGFEHKWKGKPSGLPIPYRVTIDVTSREILEIVRNYNEADRELPKPRKQFVAYVYVPGLGFYPIGLLHIMGNTTNAITAATREMLDNGMFANFPGFLIAKQASRQNTNIVRVAPGSAQQVDIGGMLDIGKAVMPLPYTTQQMPALMSLVENLRENAQRVGGTSELQVGEGRADVPVGTILAQIEQATKVANSVHKRMHAAQAEEFRLLVECFREHPESFLRMKGPSGNPWTEQMLLQALDDTNLTPQADPNTASHMQRMMKALGLKQLQASNPTMYDPIAVDKFVISSVLGFDPSEFMAPIGAMGQVPPQIQQANAKMQAEGAKAQAALQTSQARMMEAKTKGLAAAQPQEAPEGPPRQEDTPADLMAAHAKLEDAKTRRIDAQTKRQGLAVQLHEAGVEDHNRDLDRQARERETLLDFAKEAMRNPETAAEGAKETPELEKDIGV